MAVKGIGKLPVGVKQTEALRVMELLAKVNHKIGRLEEKFNHSIVSHQLVQVLALSESVESTRIEGTQVTFTDMVEEQNDRRSRWEITTNKLFTKGTNVFETGICFLRD